MRVLSSFDRHTLSIEKLKAQTAEIVVHRGTIVAGIVTDPQGKPAVGAAVGLFVEVGPGDYPKTTTDQAGRYRFAVFKPGEYTVAAAAKGFAPNSQRVRVEREPQNVTLQLRMGETIRVRVVNREGKPLNRACVSFALAGKYRDALRLDYDCSVERDHGGHLATDAQGRWSMRGFRAMN